MHGVNKEQRFRPTDETVRSSRFEVQTALLLVEPVHYRLEGISVDRLGLAVAPFVIDCMHSCLIAGINPGNVLDPKFLEFFETPFSLRLVDGQIGLVPSVIDRLFPISPGTRLFG